MKQSKNKDFIFGSAVITIENKYHDFKSESQKIVPPYKLHVP